MSVKKTKENSQDAKHENKNKKRKISEGYEKKMALRFSAVFPAMHAAAGVLFPAAPLTWPLRPSKNEFLLLDEPAPEAFVARALWHDAPFNTLSSRRLG